MGNTYFIGVEKVSEPDINGLTTMHVNYYSESIFEGIDFLNVLNTNITGTPFFIREPYKVDVDLTEVTNGNTKELPFCYIDDVFKAMVTLNPSDLDQLSSYGYNYIFTQGRPCYTIVTMEGSELITAPIAPAHLLIRDGYMANLEVTENIGDSVTRARCCYHPTSQCPASLNNHYATDHCDVIMDSYCSDNPDTSSCVAWMGSRREIPIRRYTQICSMNLHKPYCTYFINYLRESPLLEGISDQILHAYCSVRLTDPNCNCYDPPRSIKIAPLVYDAPYECWYRPCTSEITEDKWLTTQQLVTRLSCKYIDCIISLGSITTDSNIYITNACKSKSTYKYDKQKSSLDILEEDTFRFKYIGLQNNFPLLMVIVYILFHIIMYYFKKNNKVRQLKEDSRIIKSELGANWIIQKTIE